MLALRRTDLAVAYQISSREVCPSINKVRVGERYPALVVSTGGTVGERNSANSVETDRPHGRLFG